MTHQTDVLIDLDSILSRYQDADAIETFAEITKQETAFQAALSITSKVSKISILDYF
jgi:flagellar hook-associated protein 3 FlgL